MSYGGVDRSNQKLFLRTDELVNGSNKEKIGSDDWINHLNK